MLTTVATAALLGCGQGETTTEPTAMIGEVAAVRRDDRQPRTAAGVEAVLVALANAWNAGDAAAFASPFAEDVSYIAPTGLRVAGRAAVEALHVTLFRGPFNGSNYAPTVVQVELLGGRYAVLDADVAITAFRALPPGTSPTAPGLLLVRNRTVLEYSRGTWRIIRLQLTPVSPAPPPTS